MPVTLKLALVKAFLVFKGAGTCIEMFHFNMISLCFRYQDSQRKRCYLPPWSRTWNHVHILFIRIFFKRSFKYKLEYWIVMCKHHIRKREKWKCCVCSCKNTWKILCFLWKIDRRSLVIIDVNIHKYELFFLP